MTGMHADDKPDARPAQRAATTLGLGAMTRRQRLVVAVIGAFWAGAWSVALALLVSRNAVIVRIADVVGAEFLIGSALVHVALGTVIAASPVLIKRDERARGAMAKRLESVEVGGYPGRSLRDVGWDLLVPSAHFELSSRAAGRLRKALLVGIALAALAPFVLIGSLAASTTVHDGLASVTDVRWLIRACRLASSGLCTVMIACWMWLWFVSSTRGRATPGERG